MSKYKVMVAYFKLTKLLLTEVDMFNWKTTLSGVLAAMGQIFKIFGLPEEIGNAVSVIGLALLGFFAKDSNVTGGTTIQPSDGAK